MHQQSKARLLSIYRSFRSPRRALLSILASVLGVIWIGQAVAGVFLRESADPVRLFKWLTIGLTGFALWNLVKITFRKPVEPFEWTEPEKEWLCGAPLSRKQLIRYRISGISAAALFKATIFVCLMIPDLNILMLGFIGLYLALMIIEILRMSMEVLVYNMSKPQKIVLQTFMSGAILAAIFLVGDWYVGQWNLGKFTNVMSVSFLQCSKDGLMLLPDTAIGSIVCWPFGTFVTPVILALELDLAAFSRMAICGLALAVSIGGLEWLDRNMSRITQRIQKANWKSARRISESLHGQNLNFQKLRSPRGGPIGALIWRQFLGVRHYIGAVLFSLSVPMLFVLGSACGPQQEWQLVQMLVLSLAFWSFFLLPAALKFDFRRDLNRIGVLKSLPVHPMKVVIAQLVVPVVVTSIFQLVTMSLAMIVNPYSPRYLLVGIMVLLPFNVFIYALENLIFLLYPYRMAEESVRMFLRTILAFTAKGLLLGMIAGAGLLMLLTSVVICKNLALADAQSASLLIFGGASLIAGFIGSGFVVWLLAKVFGNLDPSQDLTAAQG